MAVVTRFQIDLVQGAGGAWYMVGTLQMPNKERDVSTLRAGSFPEACNLAAKAAYAFADEMAVYEQAGP